MASEVLYVNCQELHNPTFAPRIVSPHSDVSPNCGTQLLEATKAPDTEHVLPSVNLSALADALPDPSSQMEIVREEQSLVFLELQNPQLEAPRVQHVELPLPSVVSSTTVRQTAKADNIEGSCIEDIPRGPPSISVSPIVVCRVPTPSVEIAPEMQNVLTRSDSRDTPGTVAEHEAVACVPTESTLTHELPSTSDQDDEVKFILSVTRKRRRKRPRPDPLPGDQGKDTSIDVGKDAPRHIINDAEHATTLNSHTVGLNPIAAQSLSGRHPGRGNPPDYSSFPSVSLGSSSAALVSEFPKQATRKRKRNQESSLAPTLQTLGSMNVNDSMISAKTPILQSHLQASQQLSPSGPIPTVHNLAGTKLANNSHFLSRSGACCTLHGPSLPILAAPITNTAPASLASMSESLRRRPSLYAVPQWQSSMPTSGMATQDVSANAPRSIYQSLYSPMNVNLRGVSPVVPRIAEIGNILPVGITTSGHFAHQGASQARDVQQPAGPPTTEVLASQTNLSKPPYPPNMLVDIAQTCQDNFPFALIAKRHNQPIQKVFDIFSAVIQLPLLRSAVDARRPGKLGSLRMKEFRAMKRGLKEMPKGEQAVKKRGRKAESNGTSGA